MGRAHEVRAASMAKTAAMKSKKYARWGKEIFQAAKAGVPDPEMNQSLKKVIEKAKKDQCPAEVIKRAIAKAQGVASGASKEKVYEGYGPGNVAMIVECLTDNDNRTFTEVRTAFNRTGGTIGTAVGYLFSRKAQFVTSSLSEDEIMEILMEAGLDFEDLTTKEDGSVELFAATGDFNAIKEALEAAKPEIEFDECGINLIPANYVDLDEDHEAKFRRLLDALSECDDVSEVYHNANLQDDSSDEE